MSVEPLRAKLPEPETVRIIAPIPEYPSELTCRSCTRLMLPMRWPKSSHWRCFVCNRAVEIVLPKQSRA